ncbi:CTD small phosphatase-like protein 2 isoform X2 [Schistocerca gregaria]|uniref:CTD small phosphatase-like protein 2 isoform X2 n=1 Tax=Schistocerca gregaria TaxID=7010 RepID=UPI00211E322C|nr:CTD small phosphatase-like protein 2 isoform X2 [Schistocerca gregaria]
MIFENEGGSPLVETYVTLSSSPRIGDKVLSSTLQGCQNIDQQSVSMLNQTSSKKRDVHDVSIIGLNKAQSTKLKSKRPKKSSLTVSLNSAKSLLGNTSIKDKDRSGDPFFSTNLPCEGKCSHLPTLVEKDGKATLPLSSVGATETSTGPPSSSPPCSTRVVARKASVANYLTAYRVMRNINRAFLKFNEKIRSLRQPHFPINNSLEQEQGARLSASSDIRISKKAVQQHSKSKCLEDAHNDEFVDFDSFYLIAMLPPLDTLPPPPNAPCLPIKSHNAPPITLVLDLDETLVHCSSKKVDNPGMVISFDFKEKQHEIYVKKRPGFDEFLEHVSQLFETVIFTASDRVYADKLLSILDPERKWIHHRIFRESCTYVLGNYLKNLHVLGRELSKVVIIDNSPFSFAYQLDNGIPINSWTDDHRDRELLHLLPFLESAAACSDVRPLLHSKFHLQDRLEEFKKSYFL